MSPLIALCFWCSPVTIHCHFLAGIDTCYARPRDRKEHEVVAYGLPPGIGVTVSGGKEFSWTISAPSKTALPAVTAPGLGTIGTAHPQPLAPPEPILHHVQIDGRIRKVKR